MSLSAALTLILIRYRALEDLPTNVDVQTRVLADFSMTDLMNSNIMSQILEREEIEMKGKCATAQFDFIFVLDASGLYLRKMPYLNFHAVGRDS